MKKLYLAVGLVIGCATVNMQSMQRQPKKMLRSLDHAIQTGDMRQLEQILRNYTPNHYDIILAIHAAPAKNKVAIVQALLAPIRFNKKVFPVNAVQEIEKILQEKIDELKMYQEIQKMIQEHGAAIS